jgi:hypothetical protein
MRLRRGADIASVASAAPCRPLTSVGALRCCRSVHTVTHHSVSSVSAIHNLRRDDHRCELPLFLSLRARPRGRRLQHSDYRCELPPWVAYLHTQLSAARRHHGRRRVLAPVQPLDGSTGWISSALRCPQRLPPRERAPCSSSEAARRRACGASGSRRWGAGWRRRRPRPCRPARAGRA